MKNLIRKILKEVISDTEDSYISMNNKNFNKYKEEIKSLKPIQSRLSNYKDDFIKFKNSIILGYDKNKIPLLAKDIESLNNKYINYIVSNLGYQKFNNFLFNLFKDYQNSPNNTTSNNNTKTNRVICNPTNFNIKGPIKIGDEFKYKVILPEDCLKLLNVDERNIEVIVESNLNRIHFGSGIPEKLRGYKLGTLIYFKMIKNLGYITSNINSSSEIRMIYQELMSDKKYENDLMTLLLQNDIIIFDINNKNQNVNEIFKKFINGKYTNKNSVKISPKLEKILGDDYQNWYNSLSGELDNKKIQELIKKYNNLKPKKGDTVIDTKTNQIWLYQGEQYGYYEWEDKKTPKILLVNDKYKSLLLPLNDKDRLKVIFTKR